MTIDAFHGFTLAILLLFVGKGLCVGASCVDTASGSLWAEACALVVFA